MNITDTIKAIAVLAPTAKNGVDYFINKDGEIFVWKNKDYPQPTLKQIQEVPLKAKIEWRTTVNGITYDISTPAQAAWVASSAALLNAEKVFGQDISSQKAQDYLGPILDIEGNAVPMMTIAQYRQLLLSLTQAIAALR